MNLQQEQDLIFHLQDTDYNDSLGMNPVFNYFKARGIEPTKDDLISVKSLISLNFDSFGSIL